MHTQHGRCVGGQETQHTMSQIPVLAANVAAGYALYKVESAINDRVEQAVQNVVTAPFYGARAAYNYLQNRTNTQTRMAESKKRVRDYLAQATTPKRMSVPGMDSVGRTRVGLYNVNPRMSTKELGFIDGNITTSNVNTTGHIQLLNVIPNGTSGSSRIGKKVALKYIQFRGLITPGTTMANATSGAFLLVYDIRPGVTLPAISDILNSVSPFAMNNDSNNGRFKILHRQDFTLKGDSTNITPETYLNMAMFKKIPKKVEYGNAGTGTIGDITLGGLYAVFVGDGVGTAGAAAYMNFRIRYMDE